MDQETHNPQNPGPDRQVDERLVHALLLHIHDDQAAEHRERRVQRAMQAIRQPGEMPSSPARSAPGTSAARIVRFPVWFRRGVWAAAALILVMTGLWVLTYGPTPAQASLNDILSALGRPGDRTYRIQMEDLPEPSGQKPPDDRPSGIIPRPNLNDATLYLRDGRQYLLARRDPKGGLAFDGYDGRQSWRVRAGVLAETKEGLGAGGIPMPPMMADVPFSDLHQTLEHIRVDYTTEQFGQAPLPSGGEVSRYLRVRRNSREVKGPETIEIWAEPRTGMPRRIVFDRAKLQGSRQPCRLTFDLVSEEPLSENWFSPSQHIAGGTSQNRQAP